jgi:hypothetical protein
MRRKGDGPRLIAAQAFLKSHRRGASGAGTRLRSGTKKRRRGGWRRDRAAAGERHQPGFNDSSLQRRYTTGCWLPQSCKQVVDEDFGSVTRLGIGLTEVVPLPDDGCRRVFKNGGKSKKAWADRRDAGGQRCPRARTRSDQGISGPTDGDAAPLRFLNPAEFL